jgi:hypothetical protein
MKVNKLLRVLSLMFGLITVVLLGLSALALSDISHANELEYSQEWTIVQLAYLFTAAYIFVSLFTILRPRN